MLRTVIHRVAISIPLLFAVSIISFVLLALLPGNAATTILGPNSTSAEIASLEHQLGLNQPLFSQYLHWLAQAVQGNLGTSIISGQAVTTEISQHIQVTAFLILGSLIISAAIGIALGVFSAVLGGRLATLIDGLSTLGLAIPNFWLAIILVEIFAVDLGWFPANGYTPVAVSPSSAIASLVLPTITLSVVGITGIAKQTRDAMLDVLRREFVVTLRAAGVSERRIIWKHALRNAAAPIVTVTGLFTIGLLGGTVLVEEIFVLPGLGGLAVSGAEQHDLPTLQAVVLLFTMIVIGINLITDLAVGWLNPRSRTRRRMAARKSDVGPA
jgi:peptide/nickel transport system permease protein